jgi:hypothetical protein
VGQVRLWTLFSPFSPRTQNSAQKEPSRKQIKSAAWKQRQGTFEQDRKQLSAITDRVFICDDECAKKAKRTDYALHINCAPELLLPAHKGLMVVSVRYKVAYQLEQLPMFETTAKAIHEAGGAVLVNCARGRSRSVAVVLFYLMRYENMTLGEAYIEVKAARPFAGPSRHLQLQLDAIELKLFGKQSFDPTKKWALQASP